jgi:hypothetical protein
MLDFSKDDIFMIFVPSRLNYHDEFSPFFFASSTNRAKAFFKWKNNTYSNTYCRDKDIKMMVFKHTFFLNEKITFPCILFKKIYCDKERKISMPENCTSKTRLNSLAFFWNSAYFFISHADGFFLGQGPERKSFKFFFWRDKMLLSAQDQKVSAVTE